MPKVILKRAGFVLVGLVTVIIGMQFPWWAGSLVLIVICLALFLVPRRQKVIRKRIATGDEKAAKDLLEWNEGEVTHGPTAPGISNPSRRDK